MFVPAIDDEHKVIYQAAEELQRALQSGASTISEIMQRLIGGVEEHFSHEERLMSDGHYEAFEWHKRQHDTVRQRLKEYAKLFEAGDKDAAGALTTYLAGWLHDHTGLTDRMMGAFLRNRQRETGAE